jgi:DNA-binding response OmpR family regulator
MREKRHIESLLLLLTRRERDVLALALTGLLSREISLRLNINQRTVENHRAKIYSKTGVDSLFKLSQMIANAGVALTDIGSIKPITLTRWRLDNVSWSLESPYGGIVSLTRSETKLLNKLATKPGKSIQKKALIRALGHDPATYDNGSLEVMVRRLRNKVKLQTSTPLPLKTEYGVGYALATEVIRVDF